MTREEIEKAAREFRLDYVQSGGESRNTEQLMIEFAIQQVNRALEDERAKADELRGEVARLKARIAEQDGQTDRADEHTANIMQALEAAERERDEMRQRWQRASDLAGHNLDEREKLIGEVGKLKAERDKMSA